METVKTEKKSLVPALRFKEFDGEWKVAKLGGLSSKISYGIGAAATEFDGINKYLRITDIDEYSRAFAPNPLTSPEGSDFEKYRLEKGDIVFARTGASVGKSYLYKEADGNLIYAGFLIKFHISKADPMFVYTQTFKESYNKWVHVYSMRSGQPGLNAEEYKNFKINLPTLPEQQKIASFLSAVDQKIQQLTHKATLLKQYKKGVMQQLFSGALRFKDEDGNPYPDWKWVGGNKLFDNISDKNHDSDLPILAITQDQGAIPRDMIDYQMTVTEKSVASYKVVQKGDFVISLRTFQGGIEYSEYHGICSPAYIILRPSSDNVDRQFYKFYLKTTYYIKQLQKNLEGIRDGKMISYKYFSEIKLPFPSLAEQQKIANFLSSIDAKIAQVNQQLEHTQTFKKGLLQKMFV